MTTRSVSGRRRRSTAIAMCVMVLSLTLASSASGTTAGAKTPADSTIDLAPVLARDGSFVGEGSISGTVDRGAWTMVSDLAAGEPPRFNAGAGAVSALQPASHWSALGSTSPGVGAIDAQVDAIAISGTNLFIGGAFQNVAGIPEADYVARWDGSNWFALGANGVGIGSITSSVFALAISGSDLFVGGQFTNADGDAQADYVARWDGNSWSGLGNNGAGTGALNASVYALAASGGELFVGGGFSNAGGVAEADRIARWNGTSWFALGLTSPGVGPLNGFVRELAVSGTSLVVGGAFTNATGIPEADRIARWDGSNWFALGSNGAGDGALNNDPLAFAVSGNNLFAVGAFTNVAGIAAADHVARWNGTNWSSLGSNGAGDGAFATNIYGVAVSGPDVFVGGGFQNGAGIAGADYVARWDGSNWSALASTVGDLAINNSPLALAVMGTNLIVGGYFQDTDGIAEADRLATWGPLPARRPDGRIKKGTGSLVGNDIYNSTGLNQTRSGKTARGKTITFTISIQNDSNVRDRFFLEATGAGATGYDVKYFRGTTEITSSMFSGTYQTTDLAPGAAFVLQAKVKVLSGATVGSSVTRLLTATSVADATRADVVKFIGMRQ